MTADVTAPTESVRPLRRRSPAFGLSLRILGLVIAAVMTAEILLFLPSIARFRVVYLDQLIESGTLAALALDATPDNMVTEEVKRALLNNARVDAPAACDGVDHRRRAADAHRDVQLRHAHPGALHHHRAVHRRPALPGAALAGHPAAAGPVDRHDGVPPRAGRGRDGAPVDQTQRRDRRGRSRVPEPAARAARLAATEVSAGRGGSRDQQDQP